MSGGCLDDVLGMCGGFCISSAIYPALDHPPNNLSTGRQVVPNSHGAIPPSLMVLFSSARQRWTTNIKIIFKRENYNKLRAVDNV